MSTPISMYDCTSSFGSQTAEMHGDTRVLRAGIDSKFDKLDKKIDSRFNLTALLGVLLIVLQVLNALDFI